MKQDLKGRQFADIAEVQRELLVALDSISVEDFRQCFQHWERRWDRCIQSQGGDLRKGLKFQTCTNTLNNLFLAILGIFGAPHVCIPICPPICTTNLFIICTTS